MTIEDHITVKVNGLDLEKLTPGQREWLHEMNRLAMWAYIAKAKRELAAKKQKAA